MATNVEAEVQEHNRPSDHERLVRAQVRELRRLVAWAAWRFDGKPLMRVLR